MKLLFSAFILLFAISTFAQYSVCTNPSENDSHLAVSINTSFANPNISVMIGEKLNSRDFTIGFTDSLADADVIISDNSDSDLSIVKAQLGDADLSVKYGEKLINPSIRIEVLETGTVDILVYYESELFEIESLVLALLPIINAYLGYTNDAIPYWGLEGGPAVEEKQEVLEIEPIYYEGINVAHWITTIENGIIQLEDNFTFYVYDEDRYISKLWAAKNDVVVTPTTIAGHYYITKDGGIYKEPETLRAICFLMK